MNTYTGSRRNLAQALWITLGILLVGVAAAVVTAIAMTSTKVLVAVVLATILTIVFVLSGNPRLVVFYALIFLAPWNIKKDLLYYGHMAGAVSFDLHLSDPFLLALIGYQIRDWIRGRLQSYRFPPTLYLWIALMALGLWFVVMGPLRLPPAHEVYRMTRLLVWMIVIANEVVRRRQFLHAANALLIAGLAQAFFAYLQLVGLDFALERYGMMSAQDMAFLGMSTFQGERGVRRVAGIMTHPNVLGVYLALTSGIGMGLLFAPLRWYGKMIVAVVVASFTVIIVLTLSRGAWVVFAVIVLGVTTLTYTHRSARLRYFLLRTAVFGGIFVIGTAFSGLVLKRMLQSSPEAISSRFEFIHTAQKMIAAEPWSGFGLNNFSFFQPPFTKYGSVDAMMDAHGNPENWPVVHSTWLLQWAEQGTFGFIIFILLHVAIIAIGVRNLKLKDPTLHALNVGLLVGFIAIMFDGLVSFFLRLHQGIVVWTFAGLIFALDYWRRENELTEAEANDPQRGSPDAKIGFIHRPSSVGWLPRRPQRALTRLERSPGL